MFVRPVARPILGFNLAALATDVLLISSWHLILAVVLRSKDIF